MAETGVMGHSGGRCIRRFKGGCKEEVSTSASESVITIIGKDGWGFCGRLPPSVILYPVSPVWTVSHQSAVARTAAYMRAGRSSASPEPKKGCSTRYYSLMYSARFQTYFPCERTVWLYPRS